MSCNYRKFFSITGFFFVPSSLEHLFLLLTIYYFALGTWISDIQHLLNHITFQLLDYEPRSAEQVPLLMKMGKTEIALQKAIESGETELSKFFSLQQQKNRKL